MEPTPTPTGRSTFARDLLPPAVLYGVLTLVVTSPFVSVTNLAGSGHQSGDTALVMWIIGWVNRAVASRPWELFDANCFYPSTGSLAFSEHAFGLGILAQPWFWFSDDPVVPYNLLFLGAYWGSALGAYLLCLHYTASRPAALVGGAIFGFCFFRAHHFTHLQVIFTPWLPLSLLLFHRLRLGFTRARAAAFTSFVVLQCLTSWYCAAFTLLAIAFVAPGELGLRGLVSPFAGRVLACLAMAAALVLPFYLPYGRLSQPFDTAENVAFAADIGSYLQAPANTLLGRWLGNTNRIIWDERSTFVGYLPLVLGAAGLFVARRKRIAWSWAGLCVFAFVLSLGPESVDRPGLPLPARLLYPVVPGLARLRACARFALVVELGLAVLAAMAVARLRRPRLWALPLVALVVVEFLPVGLGWDPSLSPPVRPRPVDAWLRERARDPHRSGLLPPSQRERKVVLELPHHLPTDRGFLESSYMLQSTQHWLNLVNGYGRFSPPGFAERFTRYSTFPSPDAVRAMRETGVHYLVVHTGELAPERRKEVETGPFLAARLGDDLVFRIR